MPNKDWASLSREILKLSLPVDHRSPALTAILSSSHFNRQIAKNWSINNEYRDWAGLPSELLTLILTHIYSDMDVKHFRAVCKSWQSVSDHRVPSQWLLVRNFYDFEFIHPFSMDKHFVSIPERLQGATLLHSNNGWLLFQKSRDVIFFLNPFTGESINLPGSAELLRCKRVIFLSDPTSSDCMVVGFPIFNDFEMYDSVYYIRATTRGIGRWRSMVRVRFYHESFIQYASHPVHHNGMFYSLSAGGDVVVMDITRAEIVIHPVSNKPLVEIRKKSYLVECQGQLVAVFLSSQGETISVLRLDEAKMEWRTVDDLGDMLLFANHSSSYAMKKVTDGMENKIYFPRSYRGCMVFYCLATRSYKTFNNVSLNDLGCTEEHINCTWVLPNTRYPRKLRCVEVLHRLISSLTDTNAIILPLNAFCVSFAVHLRALFQD